MSGILNEMIVGGASNINLSNQSVSDITNISVNFFRNGSFTGVGGLASFSPANQWWKLGTGDVTVGDGYEVAYTALISGAGPTTGSALGVYATMSALKTWTAVSIGIATWEFTVRKLGGSQAKKCQVSVST